MSKRSTECVWGFWKIWMLERMRYVNGAGCTMSDRQLEIWGHKAADRMSTNYQRMIKDPKNRDRGGKFCMRHAKQNLLETLDEQDIDDMIIFTERLEYSIKHRKEILRAMPSAGENAKGTDKSEKSVWALWQLWIFERMRIVDGANCAYTDKELERFGAHIMHRSDENFQNMAKDPQNNDRNGRFSIPHAKMNMLELLGDRGRADMIEFTGRFEETLRNQKMALRESKSISTRRT